MTSVSRGLPHRGRLGWMLVGLLLAWSVAQGSLLQFAADAEGAGLANLAYVLGAAASLLLHDVAQALVGRAFGVPRDQIRGCTVELAVAASGPVFAVVAALVVVGVARAAFVAGAPDSLIRALAAIATFNIVLAGVNLLPALPLDGGRLVRATVGRLGRDLGRAMRVARVITEMSALLVIAVGLAVALVDTAADALLWVLVGLLLLWDRRAQADSMGVSDAAGVAETERPAETVASRS